MMLLLVAPLGLNAPVAELQRIVEGAARKYNCAVSLGMSNGKDLSHSLAAGTIDRFRERKAGPDDDFLWGSVTKTMTGAAILKLVAEGYVRLDDLAHHYVDPVLAQANYPYKTMEELFWADRWAIPPAAAFRYNASLITLRHLLSMRSGIRDFDTAAFRHLQYEHPEVDFSPLDLLDISHGPLMFRPGGPVPTHGEPHPHMHMNFNYCSLNFVLLGIILAHFRSNGSWAKVDQSAILPPRVRGARFPQRQPCAKYTQVHGYDEASNYAPFDVSSVSCAGGWTAGNLVASAAAAANWTYALYGTDEVLPERFVAMMVPSADEPIYGLATFNFSGRYANGTEGLAWGHLGDTCTAHPGFTSDPNL